MLQDSEPGPEDVTAESSNSSTTFSSMKRPASPSFESGSSSKRLREDITPQVITLQGNPPTIPETSLAEDLALELQCPCCSALAYRPVILSPCQHFFCGSCCLLWVRNGGTNCPYCHVATIIASPSRPLQSIVDAFVRKAPAFARSEGERAQADEIYRAGTAIRIPPPREPSPTEPMNASVEFARPCPHCAPGNPYGWRCPVPIVDPSVDIDEAWHIENEGGLPPGHASCGNCENLLAINAPTTTVCDFCNISFCGVNVPGRCMMQPLLTQQPHNFQSLSDLIESGDVYECFSNNSVEVDILLDYLSSHDITPRQIYREIVTYIQSSPAKFTPLFDLDLFNGNYAVPPAPGSVPTARREHICRRCSNEILIFGLYDWWIRERSKGLLTDARLDCPQGIACTRHTDTAHAREFNHVIAPPPLPLPSVPSDAPTLPLLPNDPTPNTSGDPSRSDSDNKSQSN